MGVDGAASVCVAMDNGTVRTLIPLGEKENAAETQRLGGQCWWRLKWWSLGFLLGSAVSLSVMLVLHTTNGLVNPTCQNSTELKLSRPSLSAEQLVQDRMACDSGCPTNCDQDSCMFVSDMCTCREKCMPGYKLVNMTDRMVCQPDCCPQTPTAMQCCPLDHVAVTTDSGEELCCARNLPFYVRDIPPEVLLSRFGARGRVMDMCVAKAARFPNIKADQISVPLKPLTCQYQNWY